MPIIQNQYHNFKRLLSRNVRNYGNHWKTPKKIIVFESDDWGSIRMPSRTVYETYLSKGYDLQKTIFEKYDTLESKSDIEKLMDVLRSVKNQENQSPIMTLNTIMCNPDFEKIKLSSFKEYYYEPFTETLKKYYPEDDVFGTLKTGIREGLLFPQFHGREHFNIIKWLQQLQNNDPETIEAFEYKMVGIPSKDNIKYGNQLLTAMDLNHSDDSIFYKESIDVGLKLFKDIFGYTSSSYIAPNYTWNDFIYEVLKLNGVNFIQGSVYQRYIEKNRSQYKYKKHFTGEKNEYGMLFLVRNVFFEPVAHKDKKRLISQCLKDIDAAFFWGKPAIISTHRLNYMSGTFEENARQNIDLLYQLLKKVVDKHPSVEFMTTSQLGQYITKTL